MAEERARAEGRVRAKWRVKAKGLIGEGWTRDGWVEGRGVF